ncbi:MAG: hypothetical protein QOK31_1801 [Solirubrobacteraceae bacterium]|jgi:catechol 2,3-dioxygenase-like lactoylglutathione lyase family enzyme|nr:hypothetical protein [Solirubrobacteraceae bacterium]
MSWGSEVTAKLVPELDVTDLGASLRFYVHVCGFVVRYERPEERFACLDLHGAAVMFQELGGHGRRFVTAPLERPFGRGVSFQVEVSDVLAMCDRLVGAGCPIVVPLEDRWYRTSDGAYAGNRQFVVADPDGYLMRFFEDLGVRRD